MNKYSKKSGFTLIELLVVSTIIMILATLGMVSYTSASRSARDGKRKSDMETIRQALTLYKQQFGTYPTSNVTSTLVSNGYLSEPAPADPGSYTYSFQMSTTAFCVCGQMEGGKGNTATLPSSSACTGIGGTTTGNYYCAKNL